VDGWNADLPEAVEKTIPSNTTTVVSKAMGNPSAGGPFGLLVFGMITNAIGVYLFIRGLIIGRPVWGLVFLGMATAFEVGAAGWLFSMTHAARSRVLGIDAMYARDPKVPWEFWLMFWSAAGATALGFVLAFGELRRELKWRKQKREQRKVAAVMEAQRGAYVSVGNAGYGDFEGGQETGVTGVGHLEARDEYEMYGREEGVEKHTGGPWMQRTLQRALWRRN
jgi:hypothetical protein